MVSKVSRSLLKSKVGTFSSLNAHPFEQDETMFLYLSVSNEVVSAVLVCEMT